MFIAKRTQRQYAAWGLLALALCMLALAVLTMTPQKTTYTATPIPTPGCTTFDCLVELKTKEVFERDQLKYLEQARLTALAELNTEAQDMVYVSPYIETY